MRDGYPTLMGVAGALALGVLAVAAVQGQSRLPKTIKPWAAPRTAWGDPDLHGVWNWAPGTPLERGRPRIHMTLRPRAVLHELVAEAALDAEVAFGDVVVVGRCDVHDLVVLHV